MYDWAQLAEGEWSASHTGRFTPGEIAPGTYWEGGRVGPRLYLDDVKRKILPLPGLKFRPLGCRARSKSPGSTSYEDKHIFFVIFLKKRSWKNGDKHTHTRD
jgi:hypothetical protein